MPVEHPGSEGPTWISLVRVIRESGSKVPTLVNVVGALARFLDGQANISDGRLVRQGCDQ